MQTVKCFENHEIDRKKWDACVADSLVGMIYGYSWYLDLVSPGWMGLVEEDYNSVMPLPVRKRYGIKYIYQPLFAQQLGVYSKENVHDAKLNSFIEAIPGEIKYIDTNLNYTNFPQQQGKKLKRKINFELNLRKKYLHLKENYSENTRRNIQRSLPFIELTHNVPVADLIKMKRENATKYHPPAYYERMNCFAHKLVARGNGKITGATKDGTLCAAALFLFSGKRIYYLIPVSSEEGKNNRAMFAILDHYIQTYADKNLIFDFEGSNITGIARFFEGFGAVPREYYSIILNRLPFLFRFLKR